MKNTYKIVAADPLGTYTFTTKSPFVETAIDHVRTIIRIHGLAPDEIKLYKEDKEINTDPNEYDMYYYRVHCLRYSFNINDKNKRLKRYEEI